MPCDSVDVVLFVQVDKVFSIFFFLVIKMFLQHSPSYGGPYRYCYVALTGLINKTLVNVIMWFKKISCTEGIKPLGIPVEVHTFL